MDQTPTVLFDSYEQDFRQIISSISDKLEGSGKNLVGGMAARSLRESPHRNLFARTKESNPQAGRDRTRRSR